MYEENKLDLFLIGLKKHLLIAQDTSLKKETRIQSLSNIAEVLEFVLVNHQETIAQEHTMVLGKFFNHLLVKVKQSQVSVHSTHTTFDQEIGFISVLMSL
jgi:hypothetical protein